MATYGLSARGGKYSSGKLAWRLGALVMLVLLLSVAAGAVADTLKYPGWSSLWQTLVAGLFAGWMLAVMRQPAWRALLILLAIGTIYLIIVPGGLLLSAYGVSGEFGRLLLQIGAGASPSRVDASALGEMIDQFKVAMSVILERLQLWIAGIKGGEPVLDPLVSALVWNALMWSVAAWAGWIAEAQGNALLAVLPTILFSVGVLSYANRTSWTLYVMLGSLLLMLAIVQHGRRQGLWVQSAVAYPAEKGLQILGAALLWTVVLVTVSGTLSSVSLQDIQQWVEDLKKQDAPQDDDLARSLGLPTGGQPSVDALGTERAPGLPRDHLIGSGPELSQQVVMTVSVSTVAGASLGAQTPPLYWRSFTYDIYEGSGWRSSSIMRTRYRSGQPLSSQGPYHRILLRQRVFPVRGLGGMVYAAGEPVTLSLPSEAAWRAPNDLFGVQMDAEPGYIAVSRVPVADETVLRSAGQKYPDWLRDRYLQLPDNLPSRVRTLATQLTASESAPYDRVRTIEAYLRTYPYTLDVPRPPANDDLVDFFLFDLQQGYCDYYASAMVVLSRAAGVPARFAVGYANGSYNLNSKRYVVSEADAHSWVEVYFPGVGWVPFEPTAARPAFDRSVASVEAPSPAISPEPLATKSEIRPTWPTILLVGFALVGTAVIGRAVLNEVRLRRLPGPAAAAEVYHRMRRLGRRLRATGNRGDTPLEFAGALAIRIREISRMIGSDAFGSHAGSDIARIADAIVDASYGPSRMQTPHVASLWRGLQWRLRLAWLLQAWILIRSHLKQSLG